MKIVVLMGGNTPEREVSLHTGAGVVRALGALGHQVTGLDTGDAGAEYYIRSIPAETDLVFIALHGGDGENGKLQALLDLAKIPYTGSGVLASAVAMDKAMSKRIFSQESIPTPAWGEWWAPEEPTTKWRPGLTDADRKHLGGYPLIVKPNDQGSTVGVTRVDGPEGLVPAAETARRYGRLILVERFIEGREVTVSILNGRALPVVEIIPEGGFYDYEHKYTSGASRYECPAPLPQEASERLLALGSGKPAPPSFQYRHAGHLATIGRKSAVIEFPRYKMKGWLAWWLWGIAHIYFLVGVPSPLVVSFRWLWQYITYGRGARLITGVEQAD
jgi:D-alanine-D-alanine ligase